MRNQIEAGIQKAIVTYIRSVVKNCLVMAIPNGSQRTANGRPANAVAGMLPGAPDLVVALPEGKVLWLEVKAPKGRIQDSQVLVHEKLGEIGHAIHVVRSIDEVKEIMNQLGITTREAR